jgi:hypothetical protein
MRLLFAVVAPAVAMPRPGGGSYLWCVTEPAPTDAGALVLGEQTRDRGSPAVGGPTAEVQAVADGPERAPLL